MNEDRMNSLEQRSRELFEASIEGVDMRVRSRLTQARYAALAAAARPRPLLARVPLWSSAARFSAAALLGVALWFGAPLREHALPTADTPSSFEDLEIVASSDENAADNLEMLQDDIEFYDWAAEKSGTADSSGSVG